MCLPVPEPSAAGDGSGLMRWRAGKASGAFLQDAEHTGRHAQLGGGPGVAGLVLVLGDLAGDLPELGGDGGIGGGDAFVGVEDLVVFAAAGERIETMCAMPASRM